MRYDTMVVPPAHADALRALAALEHALASVTLDDRGEPVPLYRLHARELNLIRAEVLVCASRIMLDAAAAPLIVIGDPDDPATWRPLPIQTGRAVNGLLIVPPQLADHAAALADHAAKETPCPPM